MRTWQAIERLRNLGELVCSDLLKLQQSMGAFRSDLQLGYIEEYNKSEYAPELSAVIDGLNNEIRIIRLQMMRPEAYWAPSTETRVMLYFLCCNFT